MPRKPPPMCPSCGNRPLLSEAELARQMCELCGEDTGIWVGVPQVRPPLPCPRCNHTVFVRALMRERGATGGDHASAYIAPMGVTFETSDTGWIKVRRGAIPSQPIGLLVTYVCRSCGFTELYTLEPAEIPIGPGYGTELVDVAPREGPYR